MNMKKIYKAIAKKNGVSVSQVKRDMQAAIDEVYKSPNLYARSICHEGNKPTQEEFIAYLVNSVKSTGSSTK